MNLKIIACLFVLGGTHSIQIDFGKSLIAHERLKTCLSALINVFCAHCKMIHLVVPANPDWEADAIAIHFFNSSPMYGMTIYTMDHPAYEDFSHSLGLYLVKLEVELKMALKHLREAKSDIKYGILVSFYFGENLDSYLRNKIPASWDSGNALGVAFIALIDGNIQVFGSPIQLSGIFSSKSFRKLDICETNAGAKSSQPFPK